MIPSAALTRPWNCRAACLLRRAPKPRGRSASSFATSNKNDEDETASSAKRQTHLSWPSEEHAAFAFARLVSPGRTSIGLSEFVSVLRRMQLDFNLGDCELKRVFDSLDENGDGQLSLEVNDLQILQ